MTDNIAIIIPARYGSTRFPGKPLQMLHDKTVLAHVVARAKQGAQKWPDARIAVATDDDRIADHARTLGVEVLMTDPSCQTGTDRVHAAAQQMTPAPGIIINLQGDAPFAPVAAISGIIERLLSAQDMGVATPAIQLSWDDLDALRAHKKRAPHSGTTVVTDTAGRALWFSKSILPDMRHEADLRITGDMSPVLRHVGLYGYRAEALAQFIAWPEGRYEALEKLEQLRMLENGLPIHVVMIDAIDEWALGGIDTPEDLAKAAEYLKGRGA